MNRDKRVFISFAVPEDAKYRNALKAQARKENSPFDFIDMSVKEPWSSDWKNKCRTKIKGCDGVIVLVSSATRHASGVKHEIKCAIEEGIPVRGMYISGTQTYPIPTELSGKRTVYWNWSNLKNFIASL